MERSHISEACIGISSHFDQLIIKYKKKKFILNENLGSLILR